MWKPVAVGLVAGTTAFSVMALAKSRSQPQEIALPDKWVPYTATKVISAHNSEQTGTEYRSANGSTAVYLYPEEVNTVTIHNTQTHLSYVKWGDKEWVSYPLESGVTSVPASQKRYPANTLLLLNDKVAGFDVYERRTRTGTISHIVPQLNGLLVLFQNANGAGQRYENFVLGEPPAKVFLPPPGVTLRALTQAPGGHSPRAANHAESGKH